MREEKVYCDSCEEDITVCENYLDYRIVLASERLPFEGKSVIDIYISPPIEGLKHFCGTGCLKTWVNKEFP